MNTAKTINEEKSEYDVYKIREDFPILKQQINGKPLIYLDNAASNQKPLCVINKITEIYETTYANIHRAGHTLGNQATSAYENVREIIKNFIHANSTREIIFTRGTTEALNLAAFSLGEHFINEGDEILITEMEHHSNIVPWQLMAERKKAFVKAIPLLESGELNLENLDQLITEKTKILSLTHVSNALGTINPLKKIISAAKKKNVIVVIDGAQAIAHLPVNVQELDCDFYAFSGHKIYGPTGIGVLYGKEALLNTIPPYQGGGDMIKEVTIEKTTFNTLPHKFEAGTPNIVDTIALGEAIKYVESIGLDAIDEHEKILLNHATSLLSKIEGVKIIGRARQKTGVLSFIIEGVHAHDLGLMLDNDGIAIRTGHHCTQPVMNFFNVTSTARASFALYNTIDEIDVFIESLKKCLDLLR